jgi:hypothetical protein
LSLPAGSVTSAQARCVFIIACRVAVTPGGAKAARLFCFMAIAAVVVPENFAVLLFCLA